MGWFTSIRNAVEDAAGAAIGTALGGPVGGAIGAGLTSAVQGNSLPQDVLAGAGGYFGGSSALSGLDALGNSTIDALGGVGSLGTGQTIGSLASGFGSSLSNGVSNIGSDISGGVNSLENGVGSLFGSTPAQAADMSGLATDAGSLETPAGAEYNSIMGGADATGNPLNQALASQNAAAAGGASNTLGSMLANGSTGPALGGTVGTTVGPTGIAAGGGGMSSMGGGIPGGASDYSQIMNGGGMDPTQLALNGGGPYSLGASGGMAAPAAAAAPAASGGMSGVGSLLSGVSGLANAYTTNKAEGQLAGQQALNQQQIAPYLATGNTATSNLNGLLNPGTSAASLASTPGYQFELQQGNNALNNQMAASGMTGSGSALKAAQLFGQGLAGTQYQNAISNNLAASNQGLGAVGSNAGYNTALGNIGASATQGKNANLLAALAGLMGQKSNGLNSFIGS